MSQLGSLRGDTHSYSLYLSLPLNLSLLGLHTQSISLSLSVFFFLFLYLCSSHYLPLSLTLSLCVSSRAGHRMLSIVCVRSAAQTQTLYCANIILYSVNVSYHTPKIVQYNTTLHFVALHMQIFYDNAT